MLRKMMQNEKRKKNTANVHHFSGQRDKQKNYENNEQTSRMHIIKYSFTQFAQYREGKENANASLGNSYLTNDGATTFSRVNFSHSTNLFGGE